MKTLERLGISPAPWTNTINTEKPFEINSVWDARNGCVLSGGYSESLNDARLIAAAPELYEALRMYQEVFEKIRKSAWFIDANFHEIMSLNKVMTAADAALAKAGGAWCEREYGEADNARA